MKHSKTYKAAVDKRDGSQLHAPEVAVKLVRGMASIKFDETVEVAVRLSVDLRRANQMVRGTVNLPDGIGKTVWVLVFASGEEAEAAIAAGADKVDIGDFVEKISGGYLDFNTVVVTPDMMDRVSRLGRILGPCGLMPNPKIGTVTMDTVRVVPDTKGGKVEFHVDRYANLQFITDKASFTEQQLVKNYFATLEKILRLKPAASKGRYVKKVVFSVIMSPSVLVDGTAAKPVE